MTARSPSFDWLSVRAGGDATGHTSKNLSPRGDISPRKQGRTSSNRHSHMPSHLRVCVFGLLMAPCDSGFKSPSGHLFESLTCGYSQSSMYLPDLNPHTVCAAHTQARPGANCRRRVSLVVSPPPDTWLFLFPLWEHLGNNPPTEGQTRVFLRGNRTTGIMASLEQRPRGDGGRTARVIWRQDG